MSGLVVVEGKIERVEGKLDKIEDRLDTIDKHLSVYNAQLEIHIKGTEQNSQTIQEHAKALETIGAIPKIIKWGLTVFSLFLGLLIALDKLL